MSCLPFTIWSACADGISTQREQLVGSTSGQHQLVIETHETLVSHHFKGKFPAVSIFYGHGLGRIPDMF